METAWRKINPRMWVNRSLGIRYTWVEHEASEDRIILQAQHESKASTIQGVATWEGEPAQRIAEELDRLTDQ